MPRGLLSRPSVLSLVLAIAVLGAPVVAVAVPLFPGAFSKYTGNPVLDVGAAGTWDAVEIFTPSVLRAGYTYHMWYTGGDASFHTQIGHATSGDGLVWTKDATNPVLAPGSGWDSGGTRHPSVILDGGTFRMWYAAGTPAAIGYATCIDSINWDRYPTAVLTHGEPGSWDSSYVGLPSVVKIDGTLHMWYVGRGPVGVTSSAIGHATSSDGITWSKDPNNPVFEGLAHDWEDGTIEAASVTYDTVLYHLWYSAGPGEIGHAISTDGVHWVRRARVIVRGAAGSYDADGADYASVIAGDTGYMMWYSALDNGQSGHYRIAYASGAYGPILYLPMQQMDFGTVRHQ